MPGKARPIIGLTPIDGAVGAQGVVHSVLSVTLSQQAGVLLVGSGGRRTAAIAIEALAAR